MSSVEVKTRNEAAPGAKPVDMPPPTVTWRRSFMFFPDDAVRLAHSDLWLLRLNPLP